MSASPALTALLGRLRTYWVDWKFSFVPSENTEYEPGTDREVKALNEANIVSSERKTWEGGPVTHVVALDIDYPAYVVETSTPGHHHVYLDVPGGVKHEDYMELLELLGRIGVIEKGYAEVSLKRGHSDLRLPWVHKVDQKVFEPGPGVNLSPREGETASPRTYEPDPFDVLVEPARIDPILGQDPF